MSPTQPDANLLVAAIFRFCGHRVNAVKRSRGDAWQAERYRRGEISQPPAGTGNPFPATPTTTPGHSAHQGSSGNWTLERCRRVRCYRHPEFPQSSGELKGVHDELEGLQALWMILTLGFSGTGGWVGWPSGPEESVAAVALGNELLDGDLQAGLLEP
jgi:hypothetical protein